MSNYRGKALEARFADWPPSFGNWEGGYTDRNGQRWVHVPWSGWQRDTRVSPFMRTPRAPRRWWQFWRS